MERLDLPNRIMIEEEATTLAARGRILIPQPGTGSPYFRMNGKTYRYFGLDKVDMFDIYIEVFNWQQDIPTVGGKPIGTSDGEE